MWVVVLRGLTLNCFETNYCNLFHFSGTMTSCQRKLPLTGSFAFRRSEGPDWIVHVDCICDLTGSEASMIYPTAHMVPLVFTASARNLTYRTVYKPRSSIACQWSPALSHKHPVPAFWYQLCICSPCCPSLPPSLLVSPALSHHVGTT